jgi:hypothetical protein
MPQQRLRSLVAGLAGAMTLVGMLPTHAAAADPPTPASDRTHSRIMEQSSREGLASVKMPSSGPVQAPPGVGGPAPHSPSTPVREVLGYAFPGSLADGRVGYPSWNFDLLSTVVYFGLHVGPWDGYIENDSAWSTWNSQTLRDLISVAHAHGTKVLPSINLFDFSSQGQMMCSGLTPDNRAHTIAQIRNEVAAKGADGVNVDYEGVGTQCSGSPPVSRDRFTSFVQELRAAMPSTYIVVDTYGGSAGDGSGLGFFNIPALNPNADAFMVMAYDMEYSDANQSYVNCATGPLCLAPTAPLAGYPWNDDVITNQYRAAVPSSKVILGIPYYGRYACVDARRPNARVTGASVFAASYLGAKSVHDDPSAHDLVEGRDPLDGAGAERMDWWNDADCGGGSYGLPRELYWDDVEALGRKYTMVNGKDLRGIGIFTLSYGGGAPELWNTISCAFVSPVGISGPATSDTSAFSVSFTPGCGAVSMELQQLDVTMGQGWFWLNTYPVGTPSAIVNGYPGHSYQFRVRAWRGDGSAGSWSPTLSVAVNPGATYSHAPTFKGMYTMDSNGIVTADDSPPLGVSAAWSWAIGRSARTRPGQANSPQSGVVLDGYGGLHPYGWPFTVQTTARWDWDIGRDVAFLPDGSGGYVLDGYGALHPFSVNGAPMPPIPTGYVFWGWDIARKLVIFSDGSGGFVLDGYGGVHGFGIGGPKPPDPTNYTYWGWDIARGIALIPGTTSGYVLEGYGGVHPFGSAPAIPNPGYWPGWDIARDLWLAPTSTMSVPSGYELDGWGGPHEFGTAPHIGAFPYHTYVDSARTITGG